MKDYAPTFSHRNYLRKQRNRQLKEIIAGCFAGAVLCGLAFGYIHLLAAVATVL